MEEMSRRLTPILKCITLLIFTANFFTATVLTSRPQDVDSRNSLTYSSSIQQSKPSHYVRTFTKYHHRRTIQWNQNSLQDMNWPIEQQKVSKRNVQMNLPEYFGLTEKKVVKRAVDINSVEYISKDVSSSNQFTPNSPKDNTIDDKPKAYEQPKFKVKAAKTITDQPTTVGPRISCLYKINNVAMSATPAYDDESNAQLMVESEIFDSPGELSNTILNGETVQVELCKDPRATCYTLWHQDSGNITVLGQGCWSSSRSCDRCTRVSPRLPATKFCCCTKSHCNADFMSLREEIVTPKAESTVDQASEMNHSNMIASAMLGVVAILVMGVVCRKLYCKSPQDDKVEISGGVDVEKGDVMGIGPDSLATGLLCVDNLTLIEHIGQGKFGSVWRGSLGSNPVAVKLYSNASAWQKEAAIYALSHMAHPNILKYYGSETRPTLMDGGSREQLLVLELCSMTLRQRLQSQPLTWIQFANLAHGIASAVAHLHTPSGGKPCVVHRDINSNNVLVAADGAARLADLGLAQPLRPRRPYAAPSRITEAGTLRYLAPEALEGALDLSGARCALCAVDVFALGLVLWEMLWRTNGAHITGTPPYHLPYQHQGLSSNPTLAQMQSLVSRNKARPPLPAGPVPESRALKLATDTCDECWDHDAEARLTAVCVEERMAELKQMLHTHGPVIHDNIHPHPPDLLASSPLEPEKNSNCLSTQTCDVTTPLLYPHPHIGRNACIERNTHTQTHTVTLIHKSLKDITTPTDSQRNLEENCLSVARVNPTRIIPQENSAFNEIRSYQRPLDYVQNDVSSHEERGPKQTNLLHDSKIERPKWDIRRFFDKFKNSKMETEVKLLPEVQNARTTTNIVEKPTNYDRPSNLVLTDARYNFEVPCLSPPNRTLSPTMMMESELNRENKVFGFKELPRVDGPRNQIFAVIVPKVNATDYIRSKDSNSSDSMNKSAKTSMSSQSIFKSGNSESEDSTFKKRLSIDNRIISNPSNSGRSSRASINLELQFMDSNHTDSYNISPFDLNTDCSSSEDEHLMLLSEGSKITMQTIPKLDETIKLQNEVLKESSQGKPDFGFNKFQNKYSNFDNEFSDPNDKENLVNGYSGDNPVYIAAFNGEIGTTDLKIIAPEINVENPKSPKPSLKNLTIKRQHSLEQVSEIFSSSSDIHLQNPAGRVKTPGDIPVAVRKARRDRALQKGRASECNRLSLYDDRMMFGNSL